MIRNSDRKWGSRDRFFIGANLAHDQPRYKDPGQNTQRALPSMRPAWVLSGFIASLAPKPYAVGVSVNTPLDSIWACVVMLVGDQLLRLLNTSKIADSAVPLVDRNNLANASIRPVGSWLVHTTDRHKRYGVKPRTVDGKLLSMLGTVYR